MKYLAILLGLILWATDSRGQGTLTITFDGPPTQPPGSAYAAQSYYESGVGFLAGNSDGFVRVWSDPTPTRPNDGTPYIQASSGDSLSFDFTSGAYFNLTSVDLAGYSAAVPDFTVNFIGYRSDGSTITTSFSGTGINFETFSFGPGWSGLTSVV